MYNSYLQDDDANEWIRIELTLSPARAPKAGLRALRCRHEL